MAGSASGFLGSNAMRSPGDSAPDKGWSGRALRGSAAPVWPTDYSKRSTHGQRQQEDQMAKKSKKGKAKKAKKAKKAVVAKKKSAKKASKKAAKKSAKKAA